MSWRFCSQRCWSRWARRPGAEFNLATGWWRMPRSPRPRPADGADGQQPVLDANGRPYVAQPPQPRIDGTLGVPDKPADREWAINTVSLFDSVSDPNVKLSRERISADRRAKSPRPRSRCRCPRARPTSARWICRRLAPRPPSTAARGRAGPGRRLRLRPDDARAAAPEHRPGARCSRLAGRAQARAGALRHAGLLRAPLVFLGRAQQVLCAEPRLGHDGRMPGPSAVTRSQSYRRGTLRTKAPLGAPLSWPAIL